MTKHSEETLIYAMATLFVVFDNWPWFCGTSAVHRLPPVTELALNQLYQGFTSQSIIQKKVKEECCGSATSLHVMA